MDKHKRFEAARWVFATVVLFVIALGAFQPRDSTGDVSAEPVSGASFEYFPAQYVNQAKEAEPHIQAF